MKNKYLLLLSCSFILASCGNVTTSDSNEVSEQTSAEEVISSDVVSTEHTHDYQEHLAGTGNCYIEGHDFYYTCSGCDTIFDENKNVIDRIPTKTGHKVTLYYGIIGALPEEGPRNYYECSECHSVFDEFLHVLVDGDELEDRLNYYKGCQTPQILLGKNIHLNYKSYDGVKELLETIQKDIEEGSKSLDEIKEEYNQIKEASKKVDADYYATYLVFSIYATNEYNQLNNEVSALSGELSTFKYSYESLIGKSSYRNAYFEGKTEEEIDEYLAKFDTKTQSRIDELETSMNDVTSRYQQASNPDIAVYFNELKGYGNELAALYNYDNYLDYAYENVYGRTYTPDEIMSIASYLKDYIAPIYSRLSSDYTSTSSYASSTVTKAFESLSSDCFLRYFDYLEDYAEELGGSYLEHFNGLWESGNYFLSNTDNAYTTAFQWYLDGEPFLFFSRDYQNTSTFIHEFGHYNASFSNTTSSYDLDETQSQGNELLFAQYLSNSGKITAKAMKLYTTYSLMNMISAIYSGYLSNYVEYKAYSYDGQLTSKVLQGFWNEACDLTGMTAYRNSSYWKYVLIDNPAYYISYATSALESIALYVVAKQSFELGKDAYLRIVNYPSNLTSFEDICDYAGLGNIFEEKTYQDLYTSFIG